MLEHHIQQAIIYKLAFVEAMRFSELQPDELDNKLFDYHLKLVVRDGLAQKNNDGLYSLTAKGRRIGVGVANKQFLALDRAHSVVFLLVQRPEDKAWLLFKRHTHPLINEAGLPHVNPIANKEIIETAQDELRETTGLTATFTYAGEGYFKVFKGQELESFTHFTALATQDLNGELKATNQKGEYFWATDLSGIKDQLLPTAQEILKYSQTGKPFFIDKTFKL